MTGDFLNSTLEDREQVDALAEFAPRVREVLREYRKKRQLASIAKGLGFHPALHSLKPETGNSKTGIGLVNTVQKS